MGKTLFHKVWDRHAVEKLPDGSTQLFIGTHLIHEVTSPQAFGMLRDLGLKVAFPKRTFATVDHIVPTDQRVEPFQDTLADAMIKELRKKLLRLRGDLFRYPVWKAGHRPHRRTRTGHHPTRHDHRLRRFSHLYPRCLRGRGFLGLAPAKSATFSPPKRLALSPLKVRKIEVRGKLGPGVYAKDIILHIIRTLGVNGGTGYAYEYAGPTIEALSIEERMTICNMSIEGGARAGYVNPDEKTFAYLKGRPYCPKGKAWDAAVVEWRKVASDLDAVYDDVKIFEASEIRPTVTWGINPGQGIFIDEAIPSPEQLPEADRSSAKEALEFMKFKAGQKLAGQKIQVAFFGSCTNARVSDFVEASKFLKGRKVASGIRAIAVPGSQGVSKICAEMGIDKIFREAGFDWREAGCSMCLGMNPDQLVGDEICASSSNRNFKGRQGSPTGRTLLMSPVMVAAAAVTGEVSDARKVFAQN